MKFTVEVEDFYMEEEDLSTALQYSIKTEVVREIKKSIETQVSDFMNKIMKEEIQSELKGRVKGLVEDFMQVGKVKGHYSGDQELTVKEWISRSIQKENGDIHSTISKMVKLQFEGLQKRYDLMFASQLISKINQQGYLKEDVARLLLEDGTK